MASRTILTGKSLLPPSLPSFHPLTLPPVWTGMQLDMKQQLDGDSSDDDRCRAGGFGLFPGLEANPQLAKMIGPVAAAAAANAIAVSNDSEERIIMSPRNTLQRWAPTTPSWVAVAITLPSSGLPRRAVPTGVVPLEPRPPAVTPAVPPNLSRPPYRAPKKASCSVRPVPCAIRWEELHNFGDAVPVSGQHPHMRVATIWILSQGWSWIRMQVLPVPMAIYDPFKKAGWQARMSLGRMQRRRGWTRAPRRRRTGSKAELRPCRFKQRRAVGKEQGFAFKATELSDAIYIIKISAELPPSYFLCGSSSIKIINNLFGWPTTWPSLLH